MLSPASYKQEDAAVNHGCGDFRQITFIMAEKAIRLDMWGVGMYYFSCNIIGGNLFQSFPSPLMVLLR